MKLTEKLKNKIDGAKSEQEVKTILAETKQNVEDAGVILDDAELDQVAGGSAYKAVNSALTELDEEGIDIGGDYILQWTGGKWGSP